MTESSLVLLLSRVATVGGAAAFAGAGVWAFAAERVPAPELPAGDVRMLRESVRERLDRAKWIAAGALLFGVLLEVQEMGSTLPSRHVARAVLLFIAIASHVYSVMVVKPRIRYYESRAAEGAEGGGTWRTNAERQIARNDRVAAFGFALAVASLVLV